VHKCSGCDTANRVNEDYSISPEICATKIVDGLSSEKNYFPVVPYNAEHIGFHDNSWDHENSNGSQQDRSYDGMTNSEDSRLRYGVSGR
jgi:hypothetical protein